MRAFVARRLPEDLLAPLRAGMDVGVYEEEETPVPPARLRAEAAASDGLLVLLTDRVDARLLEAAPRLRAVSVMAVGTDNVDVEACTARGIPVCNTPDVLTETTADLCFAILMACARRLPEAQRAVVEGRWAAWAPFFMAGQDVWGATLGIVGLGRIGTAVARRARGFGMRILYAGRSAHPAAEAETGARRTDLPTLLRESDFVALLAPLGPETHHLIGERELGLMKPTAVLVNAGRGPLVDEPALVRALRERRIWGAALDVFEREPLPPDHPLLGLPNVVAVPHIGSATVATRRAMAKLAAENLAAALGGGRPRACVNPEAWGRGRTAGPPRAD
jgi:glyoxylate reductase